MGIRVSVRVTWLKIQGVPFMETNTIIIIKTTTGTTQSIPKPGTYLCNISLMDCKTPNNVTRFASEYGFQSLPSFEILEPVSEPADRAVSSAWMNHRMRHPNGIPELKQQIGYKMDLPTETQLDTEAGFKEFLYLSQV